MSEQTTDVVPEDEVQRWVCPTCGYAFWVVCSNPDCDYDIEDNTPGSDVTR